MNDSIHDDLGLEFGFDDEEDDELLAEAVEASVAACDLSVSIPEPDEDDDEVLANISLGIESSTVKPTQNYDASGFDRAAGQLWIYPTNYPIRDYQYNIVQQALYRNTLVVLPTGLGKTFIAAVVMYNLYRWFPQGKVVFMAPTKPLVAQQINACYSIVGIPKRDTVEMTGNMHPSERERMWRQKRVIFLTPQVMTNDLSRGSFAATSIKCLVVDEAHKATGNHAYCQVVRELLNFSQEFRVLALSATPGSDLKRVQQVMSNLLIAHIELRSEDSIDIRPYTHERKVDKIVVPMGEELSGVRLKYIQIMETIVGRLIKNKVLYNREATKLSKFLILKARDEYRQNPPPNLQGHQYGAIEGDFATAMSLYHGFELLQLHGLRSLYNFLLGIQTGDKGYGRTRYELCRNPTFIDIMEQLQEKFALKKLDGPGPDKDEKIVVGHPKMQRLEEIVVEHFKSFQEKNMDTRVMIFSQYRDSVGEIRNILNQHQPLVKVMAFIGQSSQGKSTKGYSQKEQLKVMRQFREGGYNTLVSTCVGEEGLDIGDVDLIVCFDAHKSPIRLVQRMGRTGRKRMGRIVMLVTKGKEEQIYNQSLYSKKSIHKAILGGAKSLHFYPHNPPLTPPDIKPRCHKMFITVKPEVDNTKAKSSDKATKKKTGSKTAPDNQNITTAFNKVRSKQSSSELSLAEYEEIREEFSQISTTAKHLPRPVCTVLSKNLQLESDCSNKAMINLPEWMPWQNRLQQTYDVGHSSTARNLVQTYEFIELQQSLGVDANSYDLEMAHYLKKSDTNKSFSSLNQTISNLSGQSTIKSFFSSSQSLKKNDESSKKNSKKGVVGKGKRKAGKDNGIKKSSDRSMNKSVQPSSNTSGLFTTIKPISDKKEDDLDIEIIDIEVGNAVDNAPFHSVGDVTVGKKKARKKKLLNTKDAVWKETDSAEATTNRGGKTKKPAISVGNPDNVEQNGSNHLDVDMDFEESSNLNVIEGKRSSFNTTSKNRRESLKSRSKKGSTKNSSRHSENSFDIDDVIEIENMEDQECREETDQNETGNETEECNIDCMMPSPPRVEEVAEMFGRLESPLDFRSLDVYQLVDEWKQTGPGRKFFNVSTDISTNPINNEKKITKENRDYLCVDNVVDEEEEKITSANCLSEKPTSIVFEQNQRENRNLLATQVSNSPLAVPDNLQSAETDRAEIIFSENENDLPDVLCIDSGEDYLSQNVGVDEGQDELDPGKQSSLFNQDARKPIDDHLKETLSVDVTSEHLSNRTKRNDISNKNCFESMDEVMEAIDVDNCVFSPPIKRTSQGKLKDTSVKNLSSNNQSFATFTQALACLQSSSSESLLSPTGSTCRKRSSNTSFTDEKSYTKEKRLSPTDNSDFIRGNRNVQGAIFTSTPLLESTSNKDLRETVDLKAITPPKVAGDDFHFDFDSGDEFGTSDIIPPTPTKNCSVVSTMQSRKSQATIVNKLRNLHTLSHQEQHAEGLSENTSGTNQHENRPTLSGDYSKPLEKASQVVDLYSKRTPFDAIKDSSLNFSSNEENFPVLIQHDDKPPQDDEDNDCIIMTPPNKKQKLPFTSYENTDFIEIFDSQYPSNRSNSPLKKVEVPEQLNNFTDAVNVKPLSVEKKKKMSLKTIGKSFEEENQTPAKIKDKMVRGIGPNDFMTLNSTPNQRMSASTSTPLAKHFQASLKDRTTGDHIADGSSMLCTDHLTPIKGHTPTGTDEESDEEKSFVIRRKRKPAAIFDFSSDNETSCNRKNSWRCTKEKTDRKQDSSKEKSISFEERQKSCLDDIEDDDDFEDQGPVFTKGKKSVTPPRKTKSVKRLKKNADFIEKEADVSGEEGSSDEHEGDDDDDCYEGSFINNDTEMTQADETDMRAVYLKSMQDPVQGRYKLQFNHANNDNIYSQALPEDQGMSEYEEDSFCVGSDEEDSPVVVKKSKKKKQKNKEPQRKEKEGNRRVVQVLSDSSDDGDGGGTFPFTQEVTTNQRALAQNALMSSEDEHEKEGIKCIKNARKNNVLEDTNYSMNHFNYCEEEIHASSPDINNSSHVISEKNSMSSKIGLMNTKPIDENVGVSHQDDWLDDFDSVGMNSRFSIGAHACRSNKVNRETGVFSYNEMVSNINEIQNVSGIDSDRSRGSSLCTNKFGNDLDVNERTSAEFNWNEERVMMTSQKVRAADTIAFVKPLSRNNETSLDSNSKNTNHTNSSYSPKNSVPSVGRDLAREERLKRQKEKQDRFRQKLAQVQQSNSTTMSITKSDESFVKEVHHPVATTSLITCPSPAMSITGSSPARISNVSVTTSMAGKETLQILVDSREISGAQDVISALRLKHDMTVTAKQLASCDYVLSNHLVVDRMSWSAFSNGTNRSKLTSRLCEMQTLYRKCAIVIETDRVKPAQEKYRKYHFPHSKYLDRTMACTIQTGVKMYFTDSAEQTAALLSELCQAEQRKGRHLNVPTKLNPKKEGMFNFVMSIPQINVMEALNMVHKYNSLAEIVSSPAAVLQKKGCLPSDKVQWVYNYLRHSFDPQMLPASYR